MTPEELHVLLEDAIAALPDGIPIRSRAYGVTVQDGVFCPTVHGCCPLGALLVGRKAKVNGRPPVATANIVAALSGILSEDEVESFVSGFDEDLPKWEDPENSPFFRLGQFMRAHLCPND